MIESVENYYSTLHLTNLSQFHQVGDRQIDVHFSFERLSVKNSHMECNSSLVHDVELLETLLVVFHKLGVVLICPAGQIDVVQLLAEIEEHDK